jgi:hypothetical protein
MHIVNNKEYYNKTGKIFMIKCNIKYFIYLLLDISESFDIKVRDKNKRINLGNIYLDNKYTVAAMIAKVKVTSFIK